MLYLSLMPTASVIFKFSIFLLGFTIIVSNSLDPDQALYFVGPDLIQTVCKGDQQMTKVTTSGKRVKSRNEPDLCTYCQGTRTAQASLCSLIRVFIVHTNKIRI